MSSAFPNCESRKATGPFGLLALALCMALMGAIGACKEESPVSHQVKKKTVRPAKEQAAVVTPKVKEPKQATEVPLQSSEEVPQIPASRAKAKRDPFKSFVTTRTTVPTTTEKTPTIQTPLQRYSLDQLKVVGIVRGGKVAKVLLEDDAGKGFVVQKGDAIGSEGGKITAIKEDRIVIERIYRDVLGNKKVRRITKKLYPAEEGDNP